MRRRLRLLGFSASALLLLVAVTVVATEEDAAAAAATAVKMSAADFPKTAAVVAKDVGKNEARGPLSDFEENPLASLANSANSAGAASSSSSARSKRKSDYLTAYACEGSRLNITCSGARYLDVIRANYGRFSIAICNDHGNTDWSVNCMSPRTLRVIKARCGGQAGCEVPVDSTIFGDPCPGTFKYVEVHYACRKEPTLSSSSALPLPTPRPRPPWFPMDQVGGPNTWTTLNNHLNGIQNATDSGPHPDLEGGGAGLSSDVEGGGEEDAPKVIKVPVPKPFDFPPKHPRKPNPHLPIDIPRKMTTSRSRGPAYDPSLAPTDPTPTVRPFREPPSPPTGYEDDLHVVFNFTQFCPPSTARGLFWNWTRSGETAVLQCPSGSTGFAKWRCGADSKWATQAPTFAECRSLWLGDLDARLRDGVPIANVSNSLAYYSGLEPMYGGDIALAAKMLKHMAERMHYEIQRTASLKARESMVTDLIQNVVRAASNVIDRMNRRSWGDLDKDEAGRAATDLMVGLEENAFLLADSVTSETILVKPTDNILLSIRVMQSRNAIRQRFPSSVESLDSSSLWSNGDSIEVTSRALLKNGENGAVRVVFATYNQLDQLLGPRIASSKMSANDSSALFVNSKVISASLGKGRHIQLPEPATITFKHLRTINVSGPTCVYWDYVSHAWSEDGCKVTSSNRTHTKCKCSHLTNFALLMREGGGGGSSSELDGELNSGAAVPLLKRGTVGTHVSTIVAAVAALVSLCVIVFFLVMAWRRLKMTSQCRNALEKSGLPCFHASKELAGSDAGKDNKGNFYTVTPKMNGVAAAGHRNGNGTGAGGNAEGGENTEVVEAQQFFEHMINMQKNQDKTLPLNKSRRNNANNSSNDMQQQETNLCEDPNNRVPMNGMPAVTADGQVVLYPKRANFARALSPYNHIYMEIDPTEVDPNGGPVYEPLAHSETYMMSTISDLSEDNYGGSLRHGGFQNYSDVSRQNSSRESRPLIRQPHQDRANLLHTISGVLHSQSVRIAPSAAAAATLNPVHRRSMLPHGSLRQTQPQHLDLGHSGAHTLGRIRSNSVHANAADRSFQLSPLGENTILARLQREDGSAVPVQVTTMDGSQFVCLNINENPAGPSPAVAVMQNPVSSMATPVRQLQPQFAQPISEIHN